MAIEVTTVGVEEEYVLLDGEGLPAARSREVLARAEDEAPADADLQDELLEVQVEVATPVCRELAEVREHLSGLRARLGQAAVAVGCRLACQQRLPSARTRLP